MNDSELQQMLNDMAESEALYRPTRFWQVAIDDLAHDLAGDRLGQFRRLARPLDFFVPTYSFPGYHQRPDEFRPVVDALNGLKLSDSRTSRWLVRLLDGSMSAEADYRAFVAADRDSAPYLSSFDESAVGCPVEHFIFGERHFSRSSLNYLLGIAFLKQHCDLPTMRVVMEIGGGFGSLAEILHSDSRNQAFYLGVDIPPTLYAATYYLSEVLGARSVRRYSELRGCSRLDISELSRDSKAVLIAPWQLPAVEGNIDLFVNFISFQEMEPVVVRNYLDHVDRLGARMVLLRNLREGKAVATSPDTAGVREPIRGDTYDVFLPNYELVATNTVPFGHRTVDGFHSELRLYTRR